MSGLEDLLTSFVGAIRGQVKAEQALARVRDLCDDYDRQGLDPGTCDVRVAIEGRNSGAVTTKGTT